MNVEIVAVEYEQGEIVFAETVGFASCMEDAELEARDFLLAEPWHDSIEFIERVGDGFNDHWIPVEEGMVV